MKKIDTYDLRLTAKWFNWVNPKQPDADYNVPTIKWVKETFIPFYFAWLMEHKINTYDLKFDCDDFSTWFRMLSKVCHRHSTGTAESLSVFEIWYKAQGTGGVEGNHSIIAVYTGRWIFIEPQNGREYKLTQQEIDSIFHVIA